MAALYLAMNLAIVGVVPWRDFVPADAEPNAHCVVSIFMERVHGPSIASAFTLLILWAAFGSVFAILLGYSGIPYAAAREGYFFKPSRGFTRLTHFLTCRCSCWACSRS